MSENDYFESLEEIQPVSPMAGPEPASRAVASPLALNADTSPFAQDFAPATGMPEGLSGRIVNLLA